MNEVNDNEEQFVEVKTREINSNFYNYFIAFACFSWSVFQLYIAYFPLNTNISRSVRLGLYSCYIQSLFIKRLTQVCHFTT